MRKRMIALCAFGAMSALALMGASGGCGSDLHKAALATDSIASSLNTAAQINHTAIVSGVEPTADGEAVAKVIAQAAADNQALVAQVQSAEANGGTITAAGIVAQFSVLLNDVSTLQSQGALHIKDPSSIAQFNDVVDAIKTQIAVLQAIIGTGGQAGPVHKAPGHRSGGPALAALALTSEEIEAILGLIIPVVGEGAALVQKLLSLKGESDSALLSDATSQDAAAVKQADVDEGASTT